MCVAGINPSMQGQVKSHRWFAVGLLLVLLERPVVAKVAHALHVPDLPRRQQLTRRRCLQESSFFWSFHYVLSRACLGKMIMVVSMN